jgi:Kef-type K+ transport system membrane component KefB
MSGKRLLVGTIVMGVLVPLTIFYLLHLDTLGQLFAVAATTFTAWGAADLLARILERPRLKDRSPGQAIREDLERRKNSAES